MQLTLLFTLHICQHICQYRPLQTADEEGTGELDIETFKAKMAPHLGQDISETELVQLFMKIDADCGGTVDW